MHYTTRLSIVLLLGCGTNIKAPLDTAEEIATLIDADGDGFDSTIDCNDTDADIYPDADEVCDEKDNNCNGFIDEDVTQILYADIDLDSFGDPENSIEACEIPDGYTENNEDCDDNNAQSYPEADELCDEKDNNCNGLIDEELQYEWYLDADGDGFGDPATQVNDCNPGENYVGNAGDCDDNNPERSPTSIEICDGLDNDCNDEIDDGIGSIWYFDDDGDGFGDINAIMYSCEQPLHYAATFGDCDDINFFTNPNAIEFCDGEDNDCDGFTDESDAIDQITWYFDGDFDGFGNSQQTTLSCNQPVGYVFTGDDCDDLSMTTYPNAPEICDGVVNACGSTLPDIEIDNDGDGYVECTIDVTGWEGAIAVQGGDDCHDTMENVSPFAIEVCDGIANVCGTSLSPTETDDDGDGYVECIIDNGGWFGPDSVIGGSDCDDTSILISPSGMELCDGVANLCGTLPPEEVDNDGDGYVECTIDAGGWQGGGQMQGGDCNDTLANSHPALTEICDGIDNDCDAQVDEGLLNIYYYDADGDGFGNPNITSIACTQPSAYVTNNMDCNDGNTAVHVGAPEICDGLDNNCNNSTDEGVTTTFYYDGDSDGFGNPNAPTQACAQPPNFVSNATDCNDSISSATHIGSHSSCARASCKAIHTENAALPTGNYWIQPNSSQAYAAYCDMSTSGGGWTRVSFPDANTYLAGSMTTVNSANTNGIDPTYGPYTRDQADGHSYYYTLTFNAGFSEFRFDSYTVQANAGSGDTSDLNPNQFTISNWNQAYGGSHGDVGWGVPTANPVASLAAFVGNNSCRNCSYNIPNNTYSVAANSTRFRIAWGESGSEHEGWYPWYSGYIYLR